MSPKGLPILVRPDNQTVSTKCCTWHKHDTSFPTLHCSVLTFPPLYLLYWMLMVASVSGQLCCLVLWLDQALHWCSYWQTLKLLLQNLHPFFDLARKVSCKWDLNSLPTWHNTHTFIMNSAVPWSSKCYHMLIALQRIYKGKIPCIIQIKCKVHTHNVKCSSYM